MNCPGPPWLRSDTCPFLRRRTIINNTAGAHSYGEGVRVAVLDTGCNHLAHPSEFSSERVLRAAEDELGHGTAVCSLIAGETLGVASRVSLWVYRVTDRNNACQLDLLIQGVRQAVDAGVDLINISIGSRVPSIKLEQACNEAAAAGVLIVAAAGNDEGQSLRVPALYRSVISVGAVNANDERLSFSSFEEQPELDLVDYGEDLVVAGKGPTVVQESGTSYAAAQVTGLLSLAIAARRKLGKADFLRNAWDAHLSSVCTEVRNRKDISTGWGRLDVVKLLQLARG